MGMILLISCSKHQRAIPIYANAILFTQVTKSYLISADVENKFILTNMLQLNREHHQCNITCFSQIKQKSFFSSLCLYN